MQPVWSIVDEYRRHMANRHSDESSSNCRNVNKTTNKSCNLMNKNNLLLAMNTHGCSLQCHISDYNKKAQLMQRQQCMCRPTVNKSKLKPP